MTLEEQLEQALRSCPQIHQCLEKGVDVHAILNRVIISQQPQPQQSSNPSEEITGGTIRGSSQAALMASHLGLPSQRGPAGRPQAGSSQNPTGGACGPFGASSRGGRPPRPESVFSRGGSDEWPHAAAMNFPSKGKRPHTADNSDQFAAYGGSHDEGNECFQDMFGGLEDDCGMLPFEQDNSFFSAFGSSDLDEGAEDDGSGGAAGWSGGAVESGSGSGMEAWPAAMNRCGTKESTNHLEEGINTSRLLPAHLATLARRRPSSCMSLTGFTVEEATSTDGRGVGIASRCVAASATAAVDAGGLEKRSLTVLPMLDLSHPPAGLAASDRASSGNIVSDLSGHPTRQLCGAAAVAAEIVIEATPRGNEQPHSLISNNIDKVRGAA